MPKDHKLLRVVQASNAAFGRISDSLRNGTNADIENLVTIFQDDDPVRPLSNSVTRRSTMREHPDSCYGGTSAGFEVKVSRITAASRE